MKALGVVFLVVLIVGGAALVLLLVRGVSTHSEPTATEVVIARSLRHFATPVSLRKARNPIALDDAVLAEARAHWADHCASCHANDGSGNTELGRNLYPKAPDMRAARTQNLSDGELFAIIKNGVRLTGMPGWGGDDADNWKLVHFIRHLPKVTPDELRQMRSMNPKSPAEWQEEQFLSGK